MLDSETKRRIDSARDILVGKVPDPKSQVEQITIALIYKFMDDMDRQSIEMGGKASFFKGEFKKYGWGEIFNPRMGGVEMLNLYGEAITRMSQNANLPELFRNIFKNAYLPYRDPETLKLFLKTINDFTYDHSEKLGDAFEYLLSVLGSQGDAGQFRTPRHIIDFMVQVVDPKKNETVLDPACGTAGFLISAYKHIVNQALTPSPSPKNGRGGLSAQDKQRLYENFTGYDISPDMVRLSLVNLYLHGFVKPQIHEYDSLASEERWNEYADVILANPPFMSPKGGIMPHKKFSVQSNRSEVLFVDYMAEHLTPNGRAAIIVPEGIIFQSAGAYKQLRKYLIEHNFLWAVVSLPAGAFNPYSGVKTSILFLDKSLAKKTDKVLFVKVENDGFDLGAQRRPNDRSDLPKTLKVLKSFRASILDGKTASFAPETDSALLVSTSKLAETGDYNLSADRYREVIRTGKQKWLMVTLGEVAEYINGFPFKPEDWKQSGTKIIRIQNLTGTSNIFNYTDRTDIPEKYLVQPEDLLISWSATIGFYFWKDKPAYLNQHIFKVIPSSKISKEYLFDLGTKIIERILYDVHGNTMQHITKGMFDAIQIPLPPLEIQRQLVDEIAAHQRIIEGARQVVEGWSPVIDIDPDWEIVKLGDLCELSQGFAVNAKTSHAIKNNGDMPLLRIKDLINNTFEQRVDSSLVPKNTIVYEDDLLYTRTGQIGLVFTGRSGVLHNNSFKIEFDKNRVTKLYLYNLLQAENIRDRITTLSTRSAQPDITHGVFKSIEIPLPPLEIQREIVARIETERAIVHGNRELIRLYEEKVKKVIERVWEG